MATMTSLVLPLERPWKDDQSGHPIIDLLDITQEGIHIPDRPRDADDVLSENVRRIFQERGLDFFDKHPDLTQLINGNQPAQTTTTNDDHKGDGDDDDDEPAENDASSAQAMTTEELMKMRGEILQQLFVAHGELSLARDLLSTLLPEPVLQQLGGIPVHQQASINPSTQPPQLSRPIAATVVTGPAETAPAVQAFDAQLVVGSKDQGLRDAASILKAAADHGEKSRATGERYWVDALKLRRANWGLMPAPLPFGSGTSRAAAERPSTDFLISCGLEESPSALRRRAIGHLSLQEDQVDSVVFPHCQGTRLRVTLESRDADTGSLRTGHNTWPATHGEGEDITPLEHAIRAAQQEIVEHEIFTVLVREAGLLPTASARVSEQLIAFEVTPGTELRFQLISRPDETEAEVIRAVPNDHDHTLSARCNMIHAGLHLLLIRAHADNKRRRLLASTKANRASNHAGTGAPVQQAAQAQPPPILQPFTDLIQYEAFCSKVLKEIERVGTVLSSAGVPTRVRFNGLGDSNATLLRMLDDVDNTQRIGGEAILRIDGRHTIRFSLLAPSGLTIHLSQATVPIASIHQLAQLLAEETEHGLLERIRELGQSRFETVNGVWFVDTLAGCTIGRWEGGALSLRVSIKPSNVECIVSRMRRDQQLTATYDSTQTSLPLLEWVSQQMDEALTGPSSSDTNIDVASSVKA